MTQCLWCKPGMPPSSIGAHHAADCFYYRSPFVGPDADYWDSKLREFLQCNMKASDIVDQFIPGHSICDDRPGLVAAIAKALAEKV